MLGKIEKITDLRSVWKNEAQDFSVWLSQESNLAQLSDELGMDIVFIEREAEIGNFNVDILAIEESTSKKIIIENQLENTDHDHLGKIITYASGKDAEIIIWIVKRARDEHRQAIEWLNQHTDSNIGFFLIEIELWKINDSLPAPKFNIIERPNDWAKTIKISEQLTPTKKLQLEFWKSYNEYVIDKNTFNSYFKIRKAQPQHWYDLKAGTSSYHIQLTTNTQNNQLTSGIYIPNDRRLFEWFKSHKKEIENKIGMTLKWTTAKQDCRIFAVKDANIKLNSNEWETYFKWLTETAIKFRQTLEEYKNYGDHNEQ